MRISYLKPTDPRWPQKKYGEYWNEERRQYKNAIKDMPFTDINEQIAVLSEHYTALQTRFNETYEIIDLERLHKCKLQTIAAMNLLSQTTDPGVYQQATLQKNMIKVLHNALSSTTTEKQLQTETNKQLTDTKMEKIKQ